MSSKIKVLSPIDDSEVGTVPAMDTSGVDKAIQTAKEAQVGWAAKSAKERGQLLKEMAQVLRDNADELTDILVREAGKTPPESNDEIIRSADLIDFTVDQLSSVGPFEIKAKDFPGDDSKRTQTVSRVPVGVVLAIGPFNYPVNLTVSKIAPALAMGNAVVLKPPSQGAVVGRRMVELWQAAGLPPELIVVVTGKGSEIGDYLVTHDGIDMVAMTGSTEVGLKIAKQTGMIPLMLELGGNDPAIVLSDADLDLAAKSIVHGAFKYAGQRCTAVKRVYVEESAADDLIHRLLNARNDEFGSAGDPREHPVGPVINDDQVAYLNTLLEDAKMNGGKVICGGQHKGRVFDATVIDGIASTARLVAEEQFGPILPVVRVKDAEEAVKLANDSDYGLQACVFTKNLKRAKELADRLEVGGVHLNGPDQRGPDNFMFVGHKHSGITAQGVRFALEGMSRLKGVVENS